MTKTILNKQLKLTPAVIAIMLALTALTGVFNQTVLSLGIVVCMAVLLIKEKLYLAFPFVIFYNSFYGMGLGVSILRIYTLLILISLILKFSGKQTFKLKELIPLFVYVLYMVLVMANHIGIASSAYILLEIICCFFIVSELHKNKDAIKPFFKVYSLVALLSFLSGTIAENFIGGEYDYSRFMATFEDPNYMGFFFTVAIFALITLKLFDKRIRLIMVIALYAMLLTSLSITAIVVNIIMWVFYLIVMKKLKWWSLFIVVFVLLILQSLFNYGLENPDAPVIGELTERVIEKLEDGYEGDVDSLTTGRTDLVKDNFEYYKSHSVLNWLFGGIPVNCRYVHPDLKYVSHNEYVDFLLNIGLVGTVVMIGFFMYNYISAFKKYKINKKEEELCIVMTKTVWLFYAFALSMFIDYRFMLMFLI